MILRNLFLLFLFVAASVAVQGQIRPGPSSNEPLTGSQNGPLKTPLGSPEDEMRARMEIKIAEKERAENLERAREAAQLGSEIRQAFTTHKVLGSSEMKKLERLEKLARRIRSRSGGDDDDEPLKKVPTALESAVERLAETSEALCKGVEKTPRQVISASVIEQANELLEIIRFVRDNAR